MEYTPYFDTLRKTRLLRGMTDAELTLLTESLAPRVRRYDKGELLLMAGYDHFGRRDHSHQANA